MASAGTANISLPASIEFCDWRVQSQGDCEGTTYISFLYTTHIISSFMFLFISAGILIHNIWWKGQKVWEFSRNDNAFRPRPTEGFVLWCAGYFFLLLLVGVNEGRRSFLENFADLPWVFVSGAMGFYLVGIIYATPASFSSSSQRAFVSSTRKRRSNEFDRRPDNNTNSGSAEKDRRLASLIEHKRVYLPKPMVLNLTLLGLIVLPLITNQILATFAGAAFDRNDLVAYNRLISAMYGVWAIVVGVIFVLYIFFGKQLLTIISSNMETINDNVASASGRNSSRVMVGGGTGPGAAGTIHDEYEDHERQLNTLKSTYQRMRAILILCGSLSPIMGLMMLFFAIFRRQILNSTVASEAFSLIWIHGAR
ncbi:hypothetical protein BGZ99_009380 [Dissophora globulifera]|uniref:Uncharacterized protein n=1 Tax=Dissophora globulifera TaxID=979702 RepID=A0A9P6R8Y1_9FUNG|nr:hypothetical protein BGZ99_009380 [Dissophora globulifera]